MRQFKGDAFGTGFRASHHAPAGHGQKASIPIADLIERHRQASNWTADTDGEAFDIADEIRVALMADCHLSRVDADYLLETMI